MPHRIDTLPIPPHPDVVIESEQRVWSGRFPLDVVKFRHRRFDGAMSDTRTWELWRRGQAAALLPYDPVADAVVLIEQFRFPALAAGVDPTLVELPAGLCEDNEDPAETIRREMREEMNLDADRIERIGGFLLTAGGADEFCHLYVGRVVAPAGGWRGDCRPRRRSLGKRGHPRPRLGRRGGDPGGLRRVFHQLRSPRSACSGWPASANWLRQKWMTP